MASLQYNGHAVEIIILMFIRVTNQLKWKFVSNWCAVPEVCWKDCTHCCVHIWKGFLCCWANSISYPRCQHGMYSTLALHVKSMTRFTQLAQFLSLAMDATFWQLHLQMCCTWLSTARVLSWRRCYGSCWRRCCLHRWVWQDATWRQVMPQEMNFSVTLAAAVSWRGSIHWKSQPSRYI